MTMHARTYVQSIALVVAAALIAAWAGMARPRADGLRYEHRVVVATSALDFDTNIAPSLERQVNALAARGFALAAFVGGEGPLLDTALGRQPYSSGRVDHAGIVAVIMARPIAAPAVARSYRLLHVRDREAVAQVIAPLGAEGFRLAVSAHDGDVVHVAFERSDGTATVEFREFRNRGRRSWMDQLLADPDVRARMTQVLPIALGAGIVELGAPASTPGDVLWLSRQAHKFSELTPRVRELAAAGYGVSLVRRRGISDIDVLMVKPAGATTSTTATIDLDDGPWGGPCSRGRIDGAAVGPDGDVYCAADRGGASPASNRGLDLTMRPQSTAGGALFFRGLTCDLQARLASARPASARIAFALQLEREIARAIAPGFHVTRALAATDIQGQARIVAFTTDAPLAMPAGAPAERSEAPPLMADLDTVGDDLAWQREVEVNRLLAGRTLQGGPYWVELSGRATRSSALVLGCAPTRLARETAESAARGALIDQGLAGYRLDNRIVIER